MVKSLLRVLVWAAVLLTAAGMPAMTEDAPGITFSFKQSSDSIKGRLPLSQPLYVAIDYTSDRPVYFGVKAMTEGKVLQYFGAPVPYPAGSGTALAWCSLEEPGTAETLMIAVFDEGGTMIASKTLPAALSWTGPQVSRIETPDWAQEMLDREAAIRAETSFIEPGSLLDHALFIFVVLSIPGYLLLQLIAPAKLAGGWRKLALLPLLVMVPAVAHAAYASSIGSSAWVIGIVFMMPAAFVWLTGVLVAKGLRPA